MKVTPTQPVLRILHVVTTGQRRGAEVFVADLVRALERDGVSQHVAVLKRSGPGDLDFGAPVTNLRARGSGLPGVRVDPIALRDLRGLLRQWRPHVVQAHGGDTLKYVVWAAGEVPVVDRRIGAAPTWAARGPRRILHRALMRRATRVVTVAEALRDEVMHTFGVPADRVVTIPNAVDPRRMEPTRERVAVRREMGIPENAEVILSVGALTWEKDPLVALEILNRLGPGRRIVLLMLGAGPLRWELEREVTHSGLMGRVHFLGSRSDVADILAAGDVFLFTSRQDGMEGMPATVIEAGMMGLPVAGYAVAGVPEVVVHRATGLLAPPGDVGRLTVLVTKLLEDQRLRSRLGEAARARCRSLFDIGSIAPQYLDLYERLAGATRAA